VAEGCSWTLPIGANLSAGQSRDHSSGSRRCLKITFLLHTCCRTESTSKSHGRGRAVECCECDNELFFSIFRRNSFDWRGRGGGLRSIRSFQFAMCTLLVEGLRQLRYAIYENTSRFKDTLHDETAVDMCSTFVVIKVLQHFP
jgi:hypothetical protein